MTIRPAESSPSRLNASFSSLPLIAAYEELNHWSHKSIKLILLYLNTSTNMKWDAAAACFNFAAAQRANAAQGKTMHWGKCIAVWVHSSCRSTGNSPGFNNIYDFYGNDRPTINATCWPGDSGNGIRVQVTEFGSLPWFLVNGSIYQIVLSEPTIQLSSLR